MLIIDLLSWWYTSGWFLRFMAIGDKLEYWAAYFSFGTILRTLFSPWRQMITQAGPDQPLYVKKNALIDNLVSRTVGFGVRVIVCIAGIIMLACIAVIYVLMALLWPLVPILPILLPILGTLL